MDSGRWRLFWSSRSPFARKVAMALHEHGLADRVDLVPVVVNPMRPDPDVAAVNPLSMIPTLVLDDGRALFDSRTILDWLDRRAGRPVDDAGAVRHAIADGLTGKLVQWLDERFRQANADTEAHVEGHRASAVRVLDHWEGAVAGRTGADPDAADIATFCCLAYMDFRFAEIAWRIGRPALAGWFAQVEARPSAVATAFRAA